MFISYFKINNLKVQQYKIGTVDYYRKKHDFWLVAI
jgi:hypothetical protein